MQGLVRPCIVQPTTQSSTANGRCGRPAATATARQGWTRVNPVAPSTSLPRQRQATPAARRRGGTPGRRWFQQRRERRGYESNATMRLHRKERAETALPKAVIGTCVHS
ncbi:hypothetical protein MTO96_014972 [Rhipicephalus appendiculatus]